MFKTVESRAGFNSADEAAQARQKKTDCSTAANDNSLAVLNSAQSIAYAVFAFA